MPNETYPLEPLFGRVPGSVERFLQRTIGDGLRLIATTLLALAIATLSAEEPGA